MTEAAEFATVCFSTDDLPEKDRVAMWREHYRQLAAWKTLNHRKALTLVIRQSG
jgi:hypothetical protein